MTPTTDAANTAGDEAQAGGKATHDEGLRLWLLWALLAGGALLVLFADPLGQAVVQNCGPNGGCSWNPDDARATALDCRCAGALAFAAGLVERVLLVVTGAGRAA